MSRYPADATEEPPALAGEPLRGNRVIPVVGRLVPDPRGHRVPARRHGCRACQAGHPASLGEQVRCADHHLGWNAAEIRTLAAYQPGLDAGDPEARLSELVSDVLATWAHPDDDHVELMLAHGYLQDCQTPLLWIGRAHQGITTPDRQLPDSVAWSCRDSPRRW